MWKIRVILAGVILVSGLWAYPFARNVVSERGRVYKESEHAQSRYIGIEEVHEQAAEQIMVNPRGEGMVIFERVENRAKYPVEQYEITAIPAQSALKYAVGRVLWWERIEGSSDEYLVLYTGHGLSKYRVGYEQTGVSVEVAGYPNKLERIKIDDEQSIDRFMMHEIVKRGDTVVILPMWQIPRLSVQDEQGRYLAGGIVVRRGEGESIGASIEMQEGQK